MEKFYLLNISLKIKLSIFILLFFGCAESKKDDNTNLDTFEIVEDSYSIFITKSENKKNQGSSFGKKTISLTGYSVKEILPYIVKDSLDIRVKLPDIKYDFLAKFQSDNYDIKKIPTKVLNEFAKKWNFEIDSTVYTAKRIVVEGIDNEIYSNQVIISNAKLNGVIFNVSNGYLTIVDQTLTSISTILTEQGNIDVIFIGNDDHKYNITNFPLSNNLNTSSNYLHSIGVKNEIREYQAKKIILK